MKIEQSTFIIVANGFADGPAQALRDYLLKKKAKMVITVAHPLVPENEGVHIITKYQNGKTTVSRKRLPHKPPRTYLFDPFVPFNLPKADAWFGFNNLAALRGLNRRRGGKAGKVFYWAVDFVPGRFGKGLATKAYDKVDKYVSQRVDGRIELAATALVERPKYLGLDNKNLPPGIVVPMGAWLDRTPKAGVSGWKAKKIVYLGHLVERQGVKTLIQALPYVLEKNKATSVDIIGSGPLEADLKQLAKKLGVGDKVTFHGFVKDHKDVESILAKATVAAAPYVKDTTTFTQFADPGKLKAYLGANLPMVLTDVPPNAKDLEQAGAAVIVKDNPKAVASGLLKLLDQKNWQAAHKASAKMAKQFDWNTILKESLKEMGFE